MKKMKNESMEMFHPLISRWFFEEIGTPTDVQGQAWPQIASGSHVLVSAPTGSGKTMTAFLWALDRLVSGVWPAGQVRVLYISPLKALNNDIQRNLIYPLGQLRDLFAREGADFPDISIMTRSGDTPQQERRKMIRKPPEILITTPESLNLMLTSSAREVLRGIATVILDEVHAMAGSKRGTHLITAVERLVGLSGEFQRIALSATARPLERVADFIGGRIPVESGNFSSYKKRPVKLIEAASQKKYHVTVDFPLDARDSMKNKSWWPALTASFKEVIEKNNSTLFFGNSRRMVEKVARFINENEPRELAYAHHGSLSREVRLLVEEKLKNGSLEAIVATSSLELGIDIGDLDAVVCIQTPGSASSAIQRFGRAGHAVGETSRGYLFPTHGRDFLNAAVLVKMVMDHDIEEIEIIEAPLDVLAQVILSMAVSDSCSADQMFAVIRSSYPYRNLPREHFDLILEMLEGRYADSRIRELRPRIHHDKIKNEIVPLDNAKYHLYLSGGTIPDRGYYDLKVEDSKAKVGELDEEFVWERTIGETFSLGNRTWKIKNISHNDVEVEPVKGRPGIIPFWRAGEMNRNFHFSEKIGEFLLQAEEKLGDEDYSEFLQKEYFMEEPAAEELIFFLKRQKEITGAKLPHRRHLLVEHFSDPLNRSDSKQVIIHTLWGGKVNGPFALALVEEWERKFKYRLEVMYTNDTILLMLPHDFNPSNLFEMISTESIEGLLRSRLEKTGLFGAHFRENAGRALLLPSGGFNKRMPLWLNRLRAKKLLEGVSRYEDFPILLETWRSCLQDEYDINRLKLLLNEIQDGEIRISECVTTEASPFAGDMIFQQTNKYMYDDDTPAGGSPSGLRNNLIREVALSSHLRPQIPERLIQSLMSKLQRTAPGYAPSAGDELVQWCRERLLIPAPEWDTLTEIIVKENEDEVGKIFSAAEEKLVRIKLPGAEVHGIAAISEVSRICRATGHSPYELELTPLSGEKEISDHILKNVQSYHLEDKGEGNGFIEVLIQWLYCYGPLEKKEISALWGVPESILNDALLELNRDDRILLDVMRENSETEEICEQQNLETLLRMMRSEQREELPVYDTEHLQMFLARFTGSGTGTADLDGLKEVLEQFFAYPAKAHAWEEFIFPARLKPYYTSWLDSLMQTSNLAWYGCRRGEVTFAFPQDRDLFIENDEAPETCEEKLVRGRGLHDFFDIVSETKLPSAVVTEKLWEDAWKGHVASDTFETVRRGILHDFRAADLPTNKTSPRRSGASRWQSSRPVQGNWYALEVPESPDDILEKEELNRDRVRLLMRRYGILFRQILERELPPLKWKNLFRTLRIMELSGEITGGYFFSGIPGLQFISREGYRFLRNNMKEEGIYWLNATDPASMAGIKLDDARGRFPSRLPGNWMVFHGSRIVVTARKNFKELQIHVPPSEPAIQEYFRIFNDLTERPFNPFKNITVEKINGEAAAESEYLEAFKLFGFRTEYYSLKLWRKY